MKFKVEINVGGVWDLIAKTRTKAEANAIVRRLEARRDLRGYELRVTV